MTPFWLGLAHAGQLFGPIVWTDATGADASANVLRPLASPLISLHHPPQ